MPKSQIIAIIFFVFCLLGFTQKGEAHARQLAWCVDCATGDVTIWIEHTQGAGATAASANMTFEINDNAVITNIAMTATTALPGVTSAGLPGCSSPPTFFSSCSAVTTSNWMGYVFPGLYVGQPLTITAILGGTSTTAPECAMFPTVAAAITCGIPLCSITNLQVVPSSCDTITNTFDINGTIDFTNEPTTGTLTITDSCSGLDTVINAPFTSPQNWGIQGLATGFGSCNVTAVFSADTLCTMTLGYTITEPCNCAADIGTYTNSITPNIGQTPYKLCFGDQFTTTSNGDFTPANTANSPPISAPGFYNPGIGYLVYSCPPTIAVTPNNVFPNNDITNDPCFIGVVGFGNSFTDINVLGTPNFGGPWINNTVYFVPITYYDTTNAIVSYVNSGLPCYEMGLPIAVQYLPEITFSAVPNCQDSSVTVTVSGGLPEMDASLYTGSNLLPANASFVNNTATHGGNIVINGLQNGDMYSFDITDTNGCSVTIAGGPFVGLPNANANIDDVSCSLAHNLNAITSFGTGIWTGPAGAVFSSPNSPNSGVTVPTAGTYTFFWEEDNGNGCISIDSVNITFTNLVASASSTPTICGNDNGSITITVLGGLPPYQYSVDSGATFSATSNFTSLAANTYTVVVQDANGCTDTISETVMATAVPVANFNVNPPNHGPQGGAITFTDISTGGIVSWSWDFDATSNGGANPSTAIGQGAHVVTYSGQGTYSVTLMIIDTNGCISSITEDYLIIPDIIVPNVFTPGNGDGNNDLLVFTNLEFFENHLVVFNRWGKKVFEQDNYKNDWDGGEYSDGTYFFILDVTINGESQVFKGDVTIFR